jgi:hypothetical protein
LQKTNIIRDYLEDINEKPKCRMFWPREIWSKYVDKLEVHIYLLISYIVNSNDRTSTISCRVGTKELHCSAIRI